MDITIEGLTQKQRALCDIIWAIDSQEGVEQFISSLPKADQQQCQVLVQLMTLAFIDQIETTDEAEQVINQIRNLK